MGVCRFDISLEDDNIDMRLLSLLLEIVRNRDFPSLEQSKELGR
jgi:hypothetical protein